MNAKPSTLSFQEIETRLPHRFPFLLLDKVLDYFPDPQKGYLVAQKCVSGNEPYFLGHFPVHKVVPGVLIIESMAQASGLLVSLTVDSGRSIAFLTGIDGAKFRRSVVPGDVMTVRSEIMQMRSTFAKFNCSVKVEGELVVEAQISCFGKDVE